MFVHVHATILRLFVFLFLLEGLSVGLFSILRYATENTLPLMEAHIGPMMIWAVAFFITGAAAFAYFQKALPTKKGKAWTDMSRCLSAGAISLLCILGLWFAEMPSVWSSENSIWWRATAFGVVAIPMWICASMNLDTLRNRTKPGEWWGWSFLGCMLVPPSLVGMVAGFSLMTWMQVGFLLAFQIFLALMTGVQFGSLQKESPVQPQKKKKRVPAPA